MRKIKIEKNYLKHTEGSCLFSLGETKVLCVATVEEKVPPFIEAEKKEQGWLTAEYSMMPRSCNERISRKKLQNGRAQEISRLIGRSLRACVDLKKLGKRTITIDCDVIRADGGTRTASINGGFVALALALEKLKKQKLIDEIPLKGFLGAVSVGFVGDKMVLDLSAKEDNVADIDMNVVMLDNGDLVEVQGTAEGHAFTRKDLDKMLDAAKTGIAEIIKAQKKSLGFKL
ncbi:ribonuclease PH [Candidatus Ruminimicrobium bovinum]|uniref:ribonuclease PH n=1 Tax=Candidatus Ruminimicrobium bovinum TaxID=3242779 RepID=UPI0039B82EAC